MPNIKDRSSCYGCRCETCRWKGAAGISVGGTRDGAKIPARLERPPKEELKDALN